MFSLIPFVKRNNGLQKNDSFFDVDRVFENFFNDNVFPTFFNNSGQMHVDIKDNEKEYIIVAEIPGAKKEEINVDYDDNHLTISVQRNEESENQDNNYIRKERRTCSMVRTFVINDVISDKINAKYENGLLKLFLPKNEKAESKIKKIQIQ